MLKSKENLEFSVKILPIFEICIAIFSNSKFFTVAYKSVAQPIAYSSGYAGHSAGVSSAYLPAAVTKIAAPVYSSSYYQAPAVSKIVSGHAYDSSSYYQAPAVTKVVSSAPVYYQAPAITKVVSGGAYNYASAPAIGN